MAEAPAPRPHGIDPALGLDPRLEASGFNVAGVLASAAWDAAVPAPWRCDRLLPGARSAIVLGCGGSRFREVALAQAIDDRDPVDGFARHVVETAARSLAEIAPTRALFYWEQQEGRFADFVGLAADCGLGAPSRLGILLHRVYGPWFSLPAVLLTAVGLPASSPDPGFEPCARCPAPCAAACPGAALPVQGFDTEACVRASAPDTACARGCAARRACIVGPEHAYSAEVEAHHRRAALAFARPGPQS